MPERTEMGGGPLARPVFAAFAPPQGEMQTTAMPTVPQGQPEDRHVAKRPPRDQPFLMDGDHLRVTNVDKVPIEFAWARRRWVLEPGEEAFVLFEAVVNKLGDPRSQDGVQTHYDDGIGNRGVILERYTELTRLMAMYGVEQERIENHWDDVRQVWIPGLLELAPKVKVETADGRHVIFPCQRADVPAYPVPNADPLKVSSDTKRMFDAIQAEKDELRQRVEQLEAVVNRGLGAPSAEGE